jgi:hypothetical protein
MKPSHLTFIKSRILSWSLTFRFDQRTLNLRRVKVYLYISCNVTGAEFDIRSSFFFHEIKQHFFHITKGNLHCSLSLFIWRGIMGLIFI